MRDVVGWLKTLFPVIFFGSFLWYFWRASGSSMDGAVLMGVGPTIFGLAILMLLSLIVLLVKLIRVVSESPRTSVKASDDMLVTEDFDADAAFANYMSKREHPGETSPDKASSSGAVTAGGFSPVRSAGFGRKGLD